MHISSTCRCSLPRANWRQITYHIHVLFLQQLMPPSTRKHRLVVCAVFTESLRRYSFWLQGRAALAECGKVLGVTEHTLQTKTDVKHAACWSPTWEGRVTGEAWALVHLSSWPTELFLRRWISDEQAWQSVLMVMILRILSAPCCWWYGSTNLFLELMFSFLTKRKL